MKEKKITVKIISAWKRRLEEDEKSPSTVSKYVHDLEVFRFFCGEKTVEKSLTLAYKRELEKRYTHTSANSMIAALNSFLAFAGWQEAKLKQFKIQRSAFVPEDKELSRQEYARLVSSAEKSGKEKIKLILQTICATGIRVSELKWITVESVRLGYAQVNCKKKSRTVFIVRKLQKKLLYYIKKEKLSSGAVFRNRKGEPIGRVSVWKQMKALCLSAQVLTKKVFPHNLRHLFARTFYGREKDIVKLADILGHSSINTTRIYTVTTGMEHRRCMEGLCLIL